jgi:hypothetical protein
VAVFGSSCAEEAQLWSRRQQGMAGSVCVELGDSKADQSGEREGHQRET